MKCTLETISPIHIGCGDNKTLSPYIDYIYKDGYIHILNNLEMNRVISQLDDSIMEEYISVLRNQKSHSKNKYTLIDFLEKNDISLDQLVIKKYKSESITTEIDSSITQGNHPYIPGSSIKGAIRTAIVYYCVKNKKMSLSKRNINNDRVKNSFRYLKVSDTNLGRPSALKILKFERYQIYKKEKILSLAYQVIDKNTEFAFDLNVNSLKSDTKQLDIFKRLDGKSIFECLNLFAKDFIEYELKEFKKLEGHGIYSKYEELKEKVEKFIETGNKEALIRLGSGKTFNMNTLGLLFSPEEFKKIVPKKDKKASLPYPKTRVISKNKSSISDVLGWAVIKREV